MPVLSSSCHWSCFLTASLNPSKFYFRTDISRKNKAFLFNQIAVMSWRLPVAKFLVLFFLLDYLWVNVSFLHFALVLNPKCTCKRSWVFLNLHLFWVPPQSNEIGISEHRVQPAIFLGNFPSDSNVQPRVRAPALDPWWSKSAGRTSSTSTPGSHLGRHSHSRPAESEPVF